MLVINKRARIVLIIGVMVTACFYCGSLLNNKMRTAAINNRLIEAVKNKSVYGVATALHQGANPNTLGNWRFIIFPTLHVKPGGVDIPFSLCIEKGVDSPLSLAIENGNTAIVRLLLHRGADANAVRFWGRPLEMAAATEKREIVKALLDAGADVNGYNELSDGTALDEAVRSGNEAIVSRLLERRADSNQRLPGGDTALLHAAMNGNLAIVKLLLLHGAKCYTNDKGEDPIKMAIHNQWNDIALTLKKHAEKERQK